MPLAPEVLAPPFSIRDFTPQTPQADIDAFVDALRPYLRRVIALFNGKGGQGKTSLASHLAALLAEAEAAAAEEGQPSKDVLLAEVDLQGNTLLDLGIKGHPHNDAGLSLLKALQFGDNPVFVEDARPHLDVIPAGEELSQLSTTMITMERRHGRVAWLALAVLLANLAHQYGWVVIDCPPSFKEPQQLALAAARWVLVPISNGDAASIDGLENVATRFESVFDINPDLELLGAVLFGFEHKYYTPRGGVPEQRRPVGVWTDTRKELAGLLEKAGSDAPVFEAVIRDALPVAVACRKRGQLSFEVAEATDGIKWYQKAQGLQGSVLPTGRAEQVGQDYLDLAAEIVERITQCEREEVTA